ncbi:hypothetical protein O6H91_02G110700 [Diphasiastrum complanatum]|uniref:Uncharacterized protein n=1 Tax=Diphasiastrum complanatum TaxID=34168 RepID=A0ACC2EJD6_DIPCM|nr:hypothetical protein O6H91_02G110700 [Diphasiastrum complanatum]
MKSSKDNKGKGRKQSKGDRGSLEPTALFPRLHVKETKNGGPRAPPRNKMALYEQLTIPAHRFVHPTANPEAASPMTTTLAYPPQRPYNGGLAVPMYMAPPMPISTMSTGNHPLGPPMATQTSSNAVDCKAGCQTVSSLSHHAGRSMISLGEVSSLATSVNVTGAILSSSAGRADEDFTVPTFSSDKGSESALTGCCLTKEYLSRHQLPEQTVSGGTYSGNSTLDLPISGDFETLQSQSHSGYGKGLSLKSSKASKKSGQEEKNGAGDDEIVSKDCGLIGKANKWQSPKIQSYSSKQTQWHDSDNSGSSRGYKSQHTMLETLANHKFNGKEGPAPGDIPVAARQNNLEASSKASRNLQGSGEVFNAKRQLNVSGFGGNTREVATLLNVREAEIFHPYFNNSAEGTEDVENQTDGSGVEPSQPGGGETSDDSGSSMVDSSPASKVQPKDIIGAVGQHEFWKMRKAILKFKR